MKFKTEIQFAEPEKPVQIKLKVRARDFNLDKICENNWGQGDAVTAAPIHLPVLEECHLN